MAFPNLPKDPRPTGGLTDAPQREESVTGLCRRCMQPASAHVRVASPSPLQLVLICPRSIYKPL
jgi:hypothetical protein